MTISEMSAKKSEIEMRLSSFVGLFFGFLLLIGCQTGEVFITPPLQSKVIDAETKAPLADVVVTVWSTEAPDVRQIGKSGQHGDVDLPGLKARLRSAFPFVTDQLMPPAIARFEAEGYVSKEINSIDDYRLFEGRQPIELTPSSTISRE